MFNTKNSKCQPKNMFSQTDFKPDKRKIEKLLRLLLFNEVK